MTLTLAADHPGWREDPHRRQAVRLVEHRGVPWLAQWDGLGLALRPLRSTDADPPPTSYTSAIGLPHHPDVAALVAELVPLGTILRLTNPSLWDAVTAAVLQDAACDAPRAYRAWCSAFGRTIDTAVGPLELAPAPEAVLA